MSITLFSFRRCPYAIRARIALNIAKIKYDTIEINLKKKPQSFLNISSKGTVPVLVINEKKIIDESIEIMLWAFTKKSLSPIYEFEKKKQFDIIHNTETYFKPILDKFKYAKNINPTEKDEVRHKAELFLLKIESLLCKNTFLFSSEKLISDYAIFPFIRQFFFSDISYFKNKKFLRLTEWLECLIFSDLFLEVMKKKS